MREYIIGDGGYPLLPWLMTPFNGALNNNARIYNFKHSSSRMVVERAFGKLKNSWRILHSKQCNANVQLLPHIISVCCMLHNMVLSAGENEDTMDGIDDINEEHENLQSTEPTMPDPTATILRDALVDYINSLEEGIYLYVISYD